MYDYLLVGAGLFSSVFVCEAKIRNKSCLVVEKREHIGGNVFTENIKGINVHRYGAHIFHTSDEKIWNYVNRYAKFNRYTNSPVANFKGEIYNLPFNMNTFNKMWGVITPCQAKEMIEKQKTVAGIGVPQNLEEQAISLVGYDIYEKLIKYYTQKQWGRKCIDLPSFIIQRLPVRFTYDNNYFNDLYQGVPIGGYTNLIKNMLDDVQVLLGCNYFNEKNKWNNLAKKIIFTGPIDEYFDFCFGALEYRSVRFETEEIETENYQGNAVVNYTDFETPYTRIIEHKHFEFGQQPNTIISREYSKEWKLGDEQYYPVNDDKNKILFEKYKELASSQSKVIFGGRLGEYQYYDMDKVIARALSLAENELQN